LLVEKGKYSGKGYFFNYKSLKIDRFYSFEFLKIKLCIPAQNSRPQIRLLF